MGNEVLNIPRQGENLTGMRIVAGVLHCSLVPTERLSSNALVKLMQIIIHFRLALCMYTLKKIFIIECFSFICYTKMKMYCRKHFRFRSELS